MRIILGCCLLSALAGFAFAETAGVKVDGIPTDKDTSIVIRKGADGNALSPPDYEVVSDTADLDGDPAAGITASYANWKEACKEWKRELRELNKDQVIAMNCGSAVSSTKPNGQTTYSSKASYKLRVRIRDAKAR